MRHVHRVVWLALLAIFGAACSGAGTPETASTTPAARSDAQSTSAPEPEGSTAAAVPQELVVGAPEDGYRREEPRANVGASPLNAGIFEGLVRMDASYELIGVLATEWELIEPNTWRFTLREGVQFHDGTPFDAQAVKYTFDRIAEAGGGTLRLGPDSTVVVDDFTVEVTPTVENRRMVEQLVHPQNAIIKADTVPTEGGDIVGTGPFEFVSYAPMEELVVERNDEYWDGAATLDQITFRFLPEANARRLALESGDIDIMLDVPPADAASLESGGFVLSEPPVGVYEALYANRNSTEGYDKLSDVKVRTAVAHAIDREALIEGVFEGLAKPETSMIPSLVLGSDNADTISGYDYDPELAATLLDEAGWLPGSDGVRVKDGQRLSLELVNGFPSAAVHGVVPEFVQAQLGEVGIEVSIIETPDSAAYEDRRDSLQGDLWLERGNQNDANPAFLPALLFWSEGIFGPGSYQAMFAPGGEFDTLIVDALAAPTNEEARTLTAQAMKVMIDGEAVVIPLAGIFRAVALREGVSGFEAQPSSLQVRYNDVTITE